MKRRAVQRRVGVIMGGSSSERDATFAAGHAVADALSARGHDVVRLSVGTSVGSELWASIQRARIDVAFLALSGRLGEDGCIQGLLELSRIPYTGSSVLASALAMDKLKAKEMFRLHNVPTPPYYTVSVDDDLSDIADLHGSFGYPVIVKPRGEAASHGVARVSNFDELRAAIEQAFDYDDVALVERFVTGLEVNVAILDGEVLGAVHAVNDETPSFVLSPQRERGVVNLAERAARALGCRGAVSVDVLVTPGENEYVLEVNTQPAVTPDGLFARAASVKGYDFGALCEAMLDGGRLYQSTRKRSVIETIPAFRQSAPGAPQLMKFVG